VVVCAACSSQTSHPQWHRQWFAVGARGTVLFSQVVRTTQPVVGRIKHQRWVHYVKMDDHPSETGFRFGPLALRVLDVIESIGEVGESVGKS